MILLRLLVLGILLSALQRVVLALDSCGEDGDLTLGELASPNSTYRLLKVCLFGHWSNVCYDRFSNIDRSIALNQLGCDGGTTLNVTSNSAPVYLTVITCFGVERKLLDCRYATLLNRTDTCNAGKVAVNCSTAMRICENGELRRNETNKVINICFDGAWVPLCPYLWQSSTLAMVACRQLYPDKTVIGSNITTVTDTATNLFRHVYYHCTGNEKNLTDCMINSVHRDLRNQICSITSNEVVGIDCETAEIVNTMSPSEPCSEAVQPTPVIIISTVVQQVTQSCSVLRQTDSLNASPVVSAAFSSPLPWAGGIIIGAILSAAILFIVLAIVFLFRRKPKSQHRKLDSSVDANTESTSISTITNGVYNSSSNPVQPQTYEEFQPINKPTESEYSCIEPEYSYATHPVNNTNVYDSVSQQNNKNIPNNGIFSMPVLDNTALYSMCEETELPVQKSQM